MSMCKIATFPRQPCRGIIRAVCRIPKENYAEEGRSKLTLADFIEVSPVESSKVRDDKLYGGII